MPPTLLSTHEHAPPGMQMPNVFVVPPEEDETPTWCCFDASEPMSASDTLPDTNFLDDGLDMLELEPDVSWCPRNSGGPFTFQGPDVVSKKSGETRSIMDVLMNDDYFDTDDEMEMGAEADIEAEPSDSRAAVGDTSIGNDSDVVEVVKIGRYSDDREERSRSPTPPVKSSKSFKSRASKALRSLKIVATGSRRSKPKTQQVSIPAPAPVPNNEVELPPKGDSTLSRRGSAIFAQIFTPPSPSASISSFEVLQDIPSPAKGLRYPSSLSNRPPPNARPSESLGSPTSLNFDYHDIRSSSPTPSARTTSNRRNFSMKTLGRVFSLSSSNETSHNPSISASRKSSGPSSSSSSGPETPTDESTHLPSSHVDKHGYNYKHSSPDLPALEPGDVSFEMKLDSLHFDSLSFDADRF
ncbi:hypothetical protein H0H87_010262 [Tephrocybe sp. NHM501043]|nr:hypothetical protein H0H87_010262 [Tephrocybe sp. NHM501043]